MRGKESRLFTRIVLGASEWRESTQKYIPPATFENSLPDAFSSQDHSATISFSVPTGPSTTNDEDISTEISEAENGKAEHQVFNSLQFIGIAESTAISTISGLVPPAVVTKNTPFGANHAEAIATLSDPPHELSGESALIASEQKSGQVLFEPTGDNQEPQGSESDGARSEDIEPEDTELSSSDEELWDELDEALFEDGPNGTLTDESSEGTAQGSSAMSSTDASPAPAPGPSVEQSLNSAQSPSGHTQLQSSVALASSSLVASAIVDAYSSTPMANPPPFSLPKAGWSNLPAELRAKIYKELLLVDMHQEQKDLCHHHLHLNILRANREIHREASDILYLRNTWVKIRMDHQVQQHLESRINDAKHRKGRPIIELCSVKFTKVAALNIVVYDKDNPNSLRRTYVISSFALPEVCRMLTMPPAGTDDMASLALELDSATAPEGAVWDQKSLLDCFVETRGLGSLKYTNGVAMLAESRGKDGLVQLGAMALPLNNPAEVMERALNYLNRGRQQVRTKHIYEALTTFQEGAYYVHWLAFNPYGMSSETMADSRMNIQLESNWWDFIEECVSCCMQLGDLTWARETLLFLFKGTYTPSMDKWAEAYHMLGLIEERLGAGNAAAHSFLRALYARPGHEATENAINRLRERVDDKTNIESVIVRHNIDNVLKPFRHRTPGQPPLSGVEASRIIAHFVGQIHELNASHSYTDTSEASTAPICNRLS